MGLGTKVLTEVAKNMSEYGVSKHIYSSITSLKLAYPLPGWIDRKLTLTWKMLCGSSMLKNERMKWQLLVLNVNVNVKLFWTYQSPDFTIYIVFPCFVSKAC